MSILVTGGAGYIGSHFAWECVDQDESIVVLDNLVTGFKWAVPEQATFIDGDIKDQALVENIIHEYKVDTIVHFAGSVVVPESLVKPLKYYENNTGSTRDLLETAVRCGVKQFIFSSTAAVYEAPATLDAVNELATMAPVSPYGMSKWMSEMMIRDVSVAHGMRYVILRYFNVAGADPRGRTGLSTRGATHVMKLACEAAAGNRDHFDVYGTDYDTPDGSAVRDFIHVSDLVNAHYVAVRFLRNGGLKFTGNVGYGVGHSVLDVVEAVKRVSWVDFDVQLKPRRAGDIPAIVADSSRMQRRLNWSPRFNRLDDIVKHALAWEAQLKQSKTASAENAAPNREQARQTCISVEEKANLAPELDVLMDKITLV
ncbi:MAG: UDP-glucose 4-epimerase GalE [Rhizobiaceae bacterium]